MATHETRVHDLACKQEAISRRLAWIGRFSQRFPELAELHATRVHRTRKQVASLQARLSRRTAK